MNLPEPLSKVSLFAAIEPTFRFPFDQSPFKDLFCFTLDSWLLFGMSKATKRLGLFPLIRIKTVRTDFRVALSSGRCVSQGLRSPE